MPADFLLTDADFDAFDRFIDEVDAKIERCQQITDGISAICSAELDHAPLAVAA